MDDNEKVALLALAKGFRKTLRQAATEVYKSSDILHRQLYEINQLIDRLTEK